jgi:regulator of sigma E protease
MLTYERDGKTQTVSVTLNAQPPALGVAPYSGVPTDHSTGLELLDLNPYAPVTSQPLNVAISNGISQSWNVIISTLSLPINLIRGQISLQQARPVSIIGITQMATQVTQKAIDQGAAYPILNFAALISVAIGFTQLLPIPGLDGGRILFVVIELLRGKPISQEREGMVHLVGLLLLLGFMLIIVVNDLVNPISLR